MTKWLDRWAAYEQRKADAQLKRYRAHESAKRAGQEPLTRMDRLIGRRQRAAERAIARDRDHNDLWYQVRRHLWRGPVSGPDGVQVVISFEESGMHWLRALPPVHQWPDPHESIVVAPFFFPSLLVHLLVFRAGYSVYAKTITGPDVKAVYRLRNRIAAATYAVALAQQVQAVGLPALRQDPGAPAR